MTELSFLIDLLLNHKLPKATKELIMSRIKDVEMSITSKLPQAHLIRPIQSPTAQAPSTMALMAKHGDLPAIETPIMPIPEPVAVIAHTPAAAAAMQSRSQAISHALSGIPEKGATKPRKW